MTSSSIVLAEADKSIKLTKGKGSTANYEFGDGTILNVGYNKDEEVVEFIVKVPDNTYFAIGYGPTMTDTDMVIWQAKGQYSETKDLWSLGRMAPTLDTQQDYTSTFKQKDGYVEFTSKRKLDTGDATQDQVIELDTEIYMCFAYRQSSGSYAMHNDQGNWKLKLLSEGGADHEVLQVLGKIEGLEDYEQHGLILWASWTFGVLIELATNRYLKHYAPYHQYIHTLVGLFIIVATLMTSSKMIESQKEQEHKNLHSYLGYVIMALAILLLLQGLVFVIAANCCELRWKKDFTRRIRKFHKILGFIATLIALITIMSGISAYMKKSNWDDIAPAGPINAVVTLIMIAIWEILFRRWRKQETPWVIPAKRMTVQEFEAQVENGKHLVILDNLVIDMRDYAKYHPGGTFTISGNYGRDISKFFYGGYAMENILEKPKTHAHTNQARAIVNRYAIAVLADQIEVAQPVCQIKSATPVNQHTATYKFKTVSGNPVKNWRNYYSDLEYFAKHFMVSSIQGKRKVSRHYTICHSMLPEFKADLIKLVDEYIGGNSSNLQKFKNDHLMSQDSDCINLTIKNYQKKKGLSTKVAAVAEQSELNKSQEEYSTSKPEDTFVVKGPMGHGLKINKDGGVHVVFAAGTGVLCFLDIITHLILRQLKLIPDSEGVSEDFKLYFFVSYRSRQESMGLDLVEALERLMENEKALKRASRVFKVIRDQEGENNKRWDAAYIEERLRKFDQLRNNAQTPTTKDRISKTTEELDVSIQSSQNIAISQNEEVKRLWVCGPPSMGQLFDMTLEKLGPQYGIKREALIVL